MTNLKAYIDVNFTVEETFDDWTDKAVDKLLSETQKLIDIFKADLLDRLDYYAHNIKDLSVVVTFEGEE